MLALNGQLNATYADRLTSPHEIAAPAKGNEGFERDRKRRKAESSAKRSRKPFKHLGYKAKKLDKEYFEFMILYAGSSEST